MVIEIYSPERSRLRTLFDDYAYQRVFIEGTLDGHFGRAWADDRTTPSVALLCHALAYVGGDSNCLAASELTKKAVSVSESVVVPSAKWAKLFADIQDNRLAPVRWTSFNSNSTNIERIRQLKLHLPDGFAIKRIDREIAERLFHERILVFRTYDRSPKKFLDDGIGFCMCEGDKIAGVINSMAIYKGKLKGNIEILEPYRRRGLATTLAAHLVEYCLENNIEYCWEATNKASAAVAKKLGFTEEGDMTVYQHIEYLPSDELMR